MFSSAESIGKRIFCSVDAEDEDLVEYAGKIMVGFDIKEETMMEVIIGMIKTHPNKSAPYMKIINHLLNVIEIKRTLSQWRWLLGSIGVATIQSGSQKLLS